MNTIRKYPWLAFTALLLIGYSAAEFIICGKALNDASYGFAGWFFWAGLILLLLHFLVLPFLQFSKLPQWTDPDTKENFSEKLDTMEKYGSALAKRYRKQPPKAIEGDILTLQEIIGNHPYDPAEYAEKLEPLVKRLHEEISSGKLTTEIIHHYMMRTALIVMISQRGCIDSAAMLIMQIRMIIDLCKALGYRPSWIMITRCLCWILVNSLLFALFDGTDLLDNAIQELLPEVIQESVLGYTIKLLGKNALQAITAMALVYSSGIIVRNVLLNDKKRLSGKERVSNRILGYQEARKLLANRAKGKIEEIFSQEKKEEAVSR